MDAKHRSTNATVLYNKAKLGQLIIEAIADYDPAGFETDGPFSSFISTVDRFITTQSILQKEQEHAWPGAADDEPLPSHAPPSGMAPVPVAVNGSGAAPAGAAAPDEWDF
jgi:hypothetical protein